MKSRPPSASRSGGSFWASRPRADPASTGAHSRSRRCLRRTTFAAANRQLALCGVSLLALSATTRVLPVKGALPRPPSFAAARALRAISGGPRAARSCRSRRGAAAGEATHALGSARPSGRVVRATQNLADPRLNAGSTLPQRSISRRSSPSAATVTLVRKREPANKDFG